MFSILSGTNSFVANVSLNEQLLKSNPANAVNGNPSYTGNYTTRVCEQDAGVVTGVVKQLQSDVSGYYRKRVGKPTIIHYTKFGSQNFDSGTTLNVTNSYTDKWFISNSSVNTSTFNGSIIINSLGTSASTVQSGCITSYQTFNIYPSVSTETEIIAKYTTNKANTVCDINIGFALYTGNVLASSTASVVNGIYFKYTASCILYGCITINGVDYMTPVIPTPIVSENHTYKIVICNGIVDFIIDNIYYYSISSFTNLYTIPSVPLSIRARSLCDTSYVQTLEIFSSIVSITDTNMNKQWSHTMSAVTDRLTSWTNSMIGVVSTSQLNGTTANYTNSMNTTTQYNISNFPNVYRTGGQIPVLPTNPTNTDGMVVVVYAIGNVSGSVYYTIVNKNMIINGLTLQGCVTTTLSNPVTYVYSLLYGSNASTSSTLNDNGLTKGCRRIPIGVDTAFNTLAVGTLGLEFKVVFNPPICLNTNEFLSISARNIKTATTTGVITFLASFDGYWE